MWHRALRANAAYAVGNAVSTGALVLLVPYLINRLSPAEYGAWSLYELTIQVLNMLMLAGLDVGLMRDYWFAPDDGKRAQLAGTVLLGTGLWGGTLLVAGGGLVLARASPLLPDQPLASLSALGTAWADSILAVFLSVYRIRERATVFVALSLGRMVFFLTGAIALVNGGYGLLGALTARFGASILTLGGAVALGFRLVDIHPDWGALRRAVRYGLPLLPTNLAQYILLASDRYVLKHFSTLESVAIYTFAYKIATSLDILVTRPFAIDWAPRRFKIATYADAPARYAQVLLVYWWIAIAFAVLILAVTPALYAWLAPPIYRMGIGTVPVILLAYLVYGLSYPLNVGIMLKDRTHYLPAIGLLAAGVCLGWWWIPRFGVLGAAWATVVAYAVWSAGIGWASQRLYPVSYPWRLLALAMAGGLAGYIGLRLLDDLVTWDRGAPAIVLKISWALLTAFGSGLIIYRHVRRGEAARLVSAP